MSMLLALLLVLTDAGKLLAWGWEKDQADRTINTSSLTRCLPATIRRLASLALASVNISRLSLRLLWRSRTQVYKRSRKYRSLDSFLPDRTHNLRGPPPVQRPLAPL